MGTVVAFWPYAHPASHGVLHRVVENQAQHPMGVPNEIRPRVLTAGGHPLVHIRVLDLGYWPSTKLL